MMGDFHSQIGKRRDEERDTIGPYNYGNRNERGWKLVRFCQEHQLKIANTMFKKRIGRRWTWIAPNQEYRSQIDYIIITDMKE